MSSIKKLMCNPPAEMVALHGDPRVAGMFKGAGEGINSEYIDPEVRLKFAENVIAIEQDYMDKRKSLEESTFNKMKQQFDWVLSEPSTNKHINKFGERIKE